MRPVKITMVTPPVHKCPWLAQCEVETLLGCKICFTQAVSGLSTLLAIQEDCMQSEPEAPSNLGSEAKPHGDDSLPGMSNPQGAKVKTNVLLLLSLVICHCVLRIIGLAWSHARDD